MMKWIYGSDVFDFTQLSGKSSLVGKNDNRAKIAEREYWRTLRGDVFRDVFHDVTKRIDRALSMTKCIINALYEQDKVFGNDNFKDSDNA